MPESKITWKQWLEGNSVIESLLTLSDEQVNQKWNPTQSDSEAAWILYTEIRSRISTQPLHFKSGDEETALNSLYNLFAITRGTIETKGPECRHFATIAICLLNTHIRPLTAKWHKKKINGLIQQDDDRRKFRKELSIVQSTLIEFCHLFGKIALGNQYIDNDFIHLTSESKSNITGDDIPFKEITFNDNISNSDEIFEDELEAIKKRRNDRNTISNLAGLACSGGGIRSATISLGVAQSLYKHNILKDIDYISTVSGGGYFGSFLSSYLNSSDKDKIGLEPDRLPFNEKGKAEPKPIRQLRNNSKYLLKGGFLGKSRIAGLLFFGILVNIVSILTIVLTAVTLSKILQYTEITKIFIDNSHPIQSSFILLFIIFILALPWNYKYILSKQKYISNIRRIGLILISTILAFYIVATTLPQFYDLMLKYLKTESNVITFFISMPFVFLISAFSIGITKLTGRVFISLAGIAGPLLLLMTFMVINRAIEPSFIVIIILLIPIIIATIWLTAINVNLISPHLYYRNRLAETYLLRNNSDIEVDPQLLSNLQSNNFYTPYHLINAAVNLPSSKNPELRGRDSDFFIFSRHYCGSPLLGYCKTEELEMIDPSLDLGTAMAVSGAAASSYMGTTTIKGLSFWLALFNIRLGYWLPNPKRITKKFRKYGAKPFSLWKELFGKIDEKGKFVNLSDGGHIENLGIYELLRRKCKFIVAIDAEADPDMAFPSLMSLIRYAQIDFGINIQIDLTDLKRNQEGFTKTHFSLGKINYKNNQTGYLLYIKSSLTGNERDYILDYQKSNLSFPHETTADQFFSEAQFEAYRALGEHIGEDLFHTEVIKGIEKVNIESWFTALVRNLHQ